MPQTPKFELIFAPEAVDHLAAIEPKYDRVIHQAIDQQLRDTPWRGGAATKDIFVFIRGRS